MTETPEISGEEPRAGSTAPGLEGAGGQYADGDGATSGSASEADAIREGLVDGQVNPTSEERGPQHGRRDSER